MGGERETVVPAAGADTQVGSIRIHQVGGESHFHDDKRKLKVVVPHWKLENAWQRLGAEGGEWTYCDVTRKTCLRLRVILTKKLVLKCAIEVEEIRDCDDSYTLFQSYMSGGGEL